MQQVRFIELVEAVALHEDQIALFGGDLGVRDQGLLESALEMPRATFAGQFVHEDVVAMAGAYLYHLCKNHPFVDGNKRVAFAVMLYFLDVNGLFLQAGHEQMQEFVLAVAAGKVSKDQATVLLRQYIKERP